MQNPMTENPLDKQIQESAEKVVASLEHLLSMIGDYSNDRYYRCFVCKRKLSQHPERVFCLNRVQFDKD